MNCPRCKSPVDEDSTFCGICGNNLASLHPTGATIAEPTEQIQIGNPPSLGGDYNNNPFASLQTLRTPQQYTSDPDQATQMATQNAPMPFAPQASPTPPSSFTPSGSPASPTPPSSFTPSGSPASPTPPTSSLPPARRNRMSTAFIAGILLLLVIAVSVGTFALFRSRNSTQQNTATTGQTTNNAKPAVNNAVGTVFFTDSGNVTGKTDQVTISAAGLSAPPAGSQYDAWVLDEANERSFPLGKLSQQGQNFTLKGSVNGQNLIGLGNKFEITLEQADVAAPTGRVVLAATFPPKAFVHIRHLLFQFPSTPGNIGLLVGLRQQAQLLNSQALQLNNANPQVTQCIAQSMLDIIEGSNGQHYQPLPPACAGLNVTQVGDGMGLLGTNGYVQTAATHASLAANQSDSTETIKIHAGHVQICLTNIKGWLTSVDQNLQVIVSNPRNPHKIQDVVTLTDHAYAGVDTNNDESIDPVPGEGGAITAYNHGQLMAQLRLNPGS